MGYFTHYWSLGDNDLESAAGTPTPLDHTAGSQFVQRGVSVGDTLYIFTARRGKLYLVGKLEVGEVVHSDEEAEARLHYKVWSGRDHLIAKLCTPVQLIELPNEVVSQLRFISRAHTEPKFIAPGVLDRQALRGVRRLQAESAAALDQFLPEMEPFSPARKSFWRSNQ